MTDRDFYNVASDLAKQIASTCDNQAEVLRLIVLIQQFVTIRFPTFPPQSWILPCMPGQTT